MLLIFFCIEQKKNRKLGIILARFIFTIKSPFHRAYAPCSDTFIGAFFMVILLLSIKVQKGEHW